MSNIISNEGVELLAAVVANPNEDTPRLVYADWLQEQESVRVACPKCVSKTFVSNSQQRRAQFNCKVCQGSGTILDTSNADRAEFIRVQCQVTRTEYPDLRVRESALLTHYRDKWLKCLCPDCGGSGDELSDGQGKCAVCNGTGDLMRVPSRGDKMRDPRRPHVFRRGFIDQVTLPMTGSGGAFRKVAEQWGDNQPPTPVWRATPLAIGIVTAFPTITRLWVNDIGIFQSPRDNRWRFYFVDFSFLPELKDSDGFATKKTALDALAVAACKFAKKNPKK